MITLLLGSYQLQNDRNMTSIPCEGGTSTQSFTTIFIGLHKHFLRRMMALFFFLSYQDCCYTENLSCLDQTSFAIYQGEKSHLTLVLQSHCAKTAIIIYIDFALIHAVLK